VFVEEEYVGQYDGSGLAINTPTGSTGLALSADGPIHFPSDNFTLQITPLHTHMMGVRPMVVSESVDVTVVPETPVQVLVDGGRHHTTADEDDVLRIAGAEKPAHIVRTSFDDSFMSALAGKLGWGLREPEDTGPTDHVHRETGPSDFLANACRVAREAAISAGEPVRELHGQVEQVEYKQNKADIVTEADHQSDRIIATVIENEFPGHGVRSEESGVQEGETEYTWLVDPLDGTGNFAHGNPNYSISIALLDGDNRPIVGVVHSPETDEVFHAVDGGGAYRNETPIQPTSRDRLDESMLLSGYDPNGSFLRTFYQGTRGVRRLGSAALHLCYVAAGSADAVWEYDTYPWDVAAGLCILREAGGRATDADGTNYRLRLDDREARAPLLASNGPLHPALLDHLPADGLQQGPAGDGETKQTAETQQED
jgi:myo-inositol-1(or 4)-monophosphatase